MPDRRLLLLFLATSACKGDDEKTDASWELVVEAPAGTTAGEETAYAITALSSDGDVAELESWTLSSEDDPDLEWSASTIRPIHAVNHHIEVEALLDGLAEPLVGSFELDVAPAATSAISLELETRTGTYEIGDQVLAEVTTRDAYGNPTRDPWTLSVSGGTATIEGTVVTFASDGVYTVTATVDGTEIHDEEGPILVDSNGPVFSMIFPEHVDATASEFRKVQGSVSDAVSGVVLASLDGDALPVDDKGDFAVYRSWDFGVNAVALYAMDGDGNETALVHTVLCGDLLPWEETVPEGAVVHLGVGEGGLDEIIGVIDAEVDAIDITTALPIEIVGTKYDVAIVDVDYRYDGMVFTLEEGVIVATTSLSRIEVDIEGEVKAVFWIDATGSVDVDAVNVRVELVPQVTSSGGLTVTVAETSVVVDGLEMDFESSLYEVIDSIGLDTVLEEYVTDLLEEEIATSVEETAREQLEATLSSLVLDQTVSVLESQFRIEGEFARVDVDEGGITVGMDVIVTPETSPESPALEGSLYAAYEAPNLSALGGVAAGLNVDLLNRLLYLAWVEGALDQSMTSEELGLTPEALALVFPDATSVTFGTEAMLPPVVLPGDLMTPLEAQLGALRLVTVDQEGATLLDITVGVTLDVDLDVAGTTLTPSLELVGDPWVEVTEVGEASTGIVNYEALVELLLPQVVDNLGAALTAINLPAVGDATLTVSRVAPYGEGGGYITAVGSMDIAVD